MPGDITSEFSRDPFSRAPDPNPVGNVPVVGFSDTGARGDHAHPYGRMMGCIYNANVGASFAQGVLGRIVWDTKVNDPQGYLNTLPATDLKVPLGCAGRYSASLKLSPTPAGTFGAGNRLLVHLVSSAGAEIARNPIELGGYCSASGIFNMNDGDVIAGEVFYSAGGTLLWNGTINLVRLGPIQ
jgi:hypothetical protein